MKKLKIILILTFFSPGLSIFQDKEYIVTKANDTIYGKVTRESSFFNPSKFKFKIKDKNEKKDRDKS